MNTPEFGSVFQILLLVFFLIPFILFILTQQKTLELVRHENRRMNPGSVWFQLIPYFGLVWQFIVVTKISDSIRNELNSPIDDSIFSDTQLPSGHRPTHSAGISFAALFCISVFLPAMIKGIVALAGLVTWVYYWIQLNRYKKILKER